ncbi:MAG TPA: response regulator transcription factor [Ktedonobacteraceae bacterium]|jgi:DNA-binding NarL/FixJ family response regulator
MMKKLLLIGDDQLVRHGLRIRLALERDITIVGEVGNGAKAMAQMLTLQPDIIVIDLVMPNDENLTAIASIRKAYPSCAVILLSLYDEDTTRISAQAAGAAEFVGKREGVPALLEAIRRVSKQ